MHTPQYQGVRGWNSKVTTYGSHGLVHKRYPAKARHWIQWSQEINLIISVQKKIIMNPKAFNSNTSTSVVLKMNYESANYYDSLIHFDKTELLNLSMMTELNKMDNKINLNK